MTETKDEAHHPAPHRERVSHALLAFILVGGPLAWFAQLNLSFVVTANRCFEDGTRLSGPAGGLHIPTLLLHLICLIVALGAAITARVISRRVEGEVEGGHEQLLETGAGRTHFLATFALYLDLGFALVVAANIVALLMVPSCAA